MTSGLIAIPIESLQSQESGIEFSISSSVTYLLKLKTVIQIGLLYL